MEIVLELAMTFWQWTVVIALIVIGFISNLFDGQGEHRIGFEFTEMPHMKPIRIQTNDKGFWRAIWMWITGVRSWEMVSDFHYKINGEAYKIPKGFQFDGASVPKFLATFLSPVGVLLMGGLVHDYGYKYAALMKSDGTHTPRLTQSTMDKTFRDICIEVNGFKLMNYLAYWALVLFGFVAWHKHKKNGTHVS